MCPLMIGHHVLANQKVYIATADSLKLEMGLSESPSHHNGRSLIPCLFAIFLDQHFYVCIEVSAWKIGSNNLFLYHNLGLVRGGIERD